MSDTAANFARPQFGYIPIACVVPSKTNPRKTFVEKGLESLAASIKAQGIGQPILARPLPTTADAIEHVEIVAGERRYRAAKMAGLEEIPAIVKVMTDAEAMEFQLVENIQREDVNPIEEAEGFERLMQEHGYTADQLAKKIGKSKSHVYSRLKLVALCADARQVVFEHELPPSIALLAARMPVASTQLQFIRDVVNNYGDDEPMSYRKAAQHARDRYMLDLDRARFPIMDAKLLPSAGSCSACPKRTGNQPDVYNDISTNVCTDPECFASKGKALDDRTLAAARKRNIPVYEGEEARQFFEDSDLVVADSNIYGYERIADSKHYGKSIDSLLTPDQLPKPAAYVNLQDGKIHAMYEQTAMQLALEKAGICRPVTLDDDSEPTSDEGTTTSVTTKAPAPAKPAAPDIRALAAEQETKVRVEAYKRVRQFAEFGLTTDMFRIMLKAILGLNGSYSDFQLPDDVLGDVYDFNTSTDADIEVYIDQAPRTTLELLLMDAIFGLAIDPGKFDVATDGTIDEDDGLYKSLVALTVAAEVDMPAIRSELAPTTAEAEDADIAIGDRVRVNDDAKGNTGKKRKCCGKEGTVTDIVGDEETGQRYHVQFGSKKTDIITNLTADELTKLPADSAASDDAQSVDTPQPFAAAWPFPVPER